MNKPILKILVIDDDPDIGFMLKMMLEFRGYKVEVVQTANNLLPVITNGNFQMIILDKLVGGYNGTDICRMIKSHSAIAEIPVLMISALYHAEKKCMEAGANGFLAKPFEMDQLLSKVNEMTNVPY